MPATESRQACVDRWSRTAADALVGRRIVGVSYTSEEENRESCWSESGIVLELDNGVCLIPLRDDEGNGPGALATTVDGLPTLPMI